MGDEFPYLTMSQAAAMADESYFTIKNRIKSGVIKSIKTPVGNFIHKDEMTSYLKRRGAKTGRGYYRDTDLIPTQSGDSNDERE